MENKTFDTFKSLDNYINSNAEFWGRNNLNILIKIPPSIFTEIQNLVFDYNGERGKYGMLAETFVSKNNIVYNPLKKEIYSAYGLCKMKVV